MSFLLFNDDFDRFFTQISYNQALVSYAIFPYMALVWFFYAAF